MEKVKRTSVLKVSTDKTKTCLHSDDKFFDKIIVVDNTYSKLDNPSFLENWLFAVVS